MFAQIMPAQISPSTALVGAELAASFGPSADPMLEICAYALLPAGKLLRPTLLLECAQAVGGQPESLLAAGIAAELGHTASLIHDDIIDGDLQRRGRESLMAHYGAGPALVAGDFLIFSLFQSLSRCRMTGIADDRIVSALSVFATVGMELCCGQNMEFDLQGKLNCTVGDYLAMVSGKTAALFRGACQVGAILGGADADLIEALATFGHHLGIAFQIIDDLLPYLDIDTGKDNASDIRNRRPTLPVLLAARAANPAQTARLVAVLTGEAVGPESQAEFASVLVDTGAIDAARQTAEEHARLARAALSALPESPSRDRLARYTDNVTAAHNGSGGQEC